MMTLEFLDRIMGIFADLEPGRSIQIRELSVMTDALREDVEAAVVHLMDRGMVRWNYNYRRRPKVPKDQKRKKVDGER